jgi:spore coat protein H
MDSLLDGWAERVQRIVSTIAVLIILAGCGATEAAGPCDEVSCSGHGVCVDTVEGPSCECDDGYVVAGLDCVKPTLTPAILHLSAKEESVTEGGAASFLLVVSGPLERDDPVDAILETAEGKAVAPFVPGKLPRSYRADVTWAQLNALEPLTFLQPAPRDFVVRVWDDKGWEDTATVSVLPVCPNDSGACRGACDSRMTVDKSVALGETTCASWTCGEPTPLPCLSLAPAWLWMAEEQYDKLHKDVTADVEVDALFYFMGQCGEVGVEIHGGLARKFDKKSFKVKFNRGGWFPYDPFVSGPQPALAAPGFKQFIFKAHWVDPSLIRDRLTNDLARALGGLSPRVTHTHLMLNGKYHGVYGLDESILDDYFLRLGLPASGNLYKAVNHSANFNHKAEATTGYEKKMGVLDDNEDLEELLEEIAQTPLTFDTFEESVGERVDLDLYLAYSVSNAFANNQDAFTKNYYLYAEPGDPFLTVNWDADATFGISWDGTFEPADTGGLWGKINGLSGKLKQIPEYQAANAEIFASGLSGPLSPEVLGARVDALVATLKPDVRFEECRWQKEASFDDHVEAIRQFISDRTGVVEEWLE